MHAAQEVDTGSDRPWIRHAGGRTWTDTRHLGWCCICGSLGNKHTMRRREVRGLLRSEMALYQHGRETNVHYPDLVLIEDTGKYEIHECSVCMRGEPLGWNRTPFPGHPSYRGPPTLEGVEQRVIPGPPQGSPRHPPESEDDPARVPPHIRIWQEPGVAPFFSDPQFHFTIFYKCGANVTRWNPDGCRGIFASKRWDPRVRPEIRQLDSIGRGYCSCNARYRVSFGTVLEITDARTRPLQSWFFLADWPAFDIMEFRALLRLTALRTYGSATIQPRDLLTYLPPIAPLPRDRVVERARADHLEYRGHWMLREPLRWESFPWVDLDEVVDRVAGTYDVENWDAYSWTQKRDLRAKVLREAKAHMDGWDHVQAHRASALMAGRPDPAPPPGPPPTGPNSHGSADVQGTGDHEEDHPMPPPPADTSGLATGVSQGGQVHSAVLPTASAPVTLGPAL